MAILQEPVQTSMNHSQFITRCIDQILQSPTSDMKVIHAKALYDYMTVQGFNYVIEHTYFKTVAIKKAYDLKRECGDFIELENSLNRFLTTLGEPLERGEIDEMDINIEL